MGNSCCCDIDREAELQNEKNNENVKRRVFFWKKRFERLAKRKNQPNLSIADREESNKDDEEELDSCDEVCL